MTSVSWVKWGKGVTVNINKSKTTLQTIIFVVSHGLPSSDLSFLVCYNTLLHTIVSPGLSSFGTIDPNSQDIWSGRTSSYNDHPRGEYRLWNVTHGSSSQKSSLSSEPYPWPTLSCFRLGTDGQGRDRGGWSFSMDLTEFRLGREE